MYDGNSCISTFFGCKINHYLEFFYSFFYGSPLIKIKCLSVQHTTKLYIYKKKNRKSKLYFNVGYKKCCLFHAEHLHIRGLFVNSQIWLVKTLACPFIFIHCLIERFNDIQKKSLC